MNLQPRLKSRQRTLCGCVPLWVSAHNMHICVPRTNRMLSCGGGQSYCCAVPWLDGAWGRAPTDFLPQQESSLNVFSVQLERQVSTHTHTCSVKFMPRTDIAEFERWFPMDGPGIPTIRSVPWPFRRPSS